MEHIVYSTPIQGTDKLKQPFLDTLSKYNEERPGPLEATWDQTQKDVSQTLANIESNQQRELFPPSLPAALLRGLLPC